MRKNRQRGELVVEASLVVTIVALFVTLMFYIGMVLYQQTALTVMANKTASSIAQLYGNNQKDPFTGYVDSDGVYQNITYKNIKTDSYLLTLQSKAESFGIYSIKSSNILSTGNPQISVEIVDKKDELLKNQIVVTVTDEFNIPLAGIFGVDGRMKMSATARADCVDFLEYVSSIDAISNPEDTNILSMDEINYKTVTFIDNVDKNRVVAVVPVLTVHSISSAESVREAHIFLPNNPEIKGIEFKGWADSSGNPFTKGTAVNNNITVYGSWECTVTFNANYSGGKTDTKKVAYGKTLKFPEFKRDGYSLVGWYANKECTGEQFYSGSTVFKTSYDLYAKWQCIHIYEQKLIRTGNCVTRHRYKYTCKRCKDTYEQDGGYGDHSFGGDYRVRAATCVQRELWRRVCAHCGTHQDYLGNMGGHSFSGKCGVTHNLGGDSYTMNGHSGKPAYQKTTKGECNVCIHCRGLWNSNNNTAGWMWRNGQVTSIGMYCRQHITNGKYYNDSAYSERPVIGGAYGH